MTFPDFEMSKLKIELWSTPDYESSKEIYVIWSTPHLALFNCKSEICFTLDFEIFKGQQLNLEYSRY